MKKATYNEDTTVRSSIYGGLTAKSCDARFWEKEMTRGWMVAINSGRKPEEIELFRDAKRMMEACIALGGEV